MSTTAWTGFHLIWALVAFRNVSALMYSVGMFVSMCFSIHIILVITNWRQQAQKAVDEADAHMSLTTLSWGLFTWDVHIDMIFFLVALISLIIREDKLLATHKISVICEALFPPGGGSLWAAGSPTVRPLGVQTHLPNLSTCSVRQVLAQNCPLHKDSQRVTSPISEEKLRAGICFGEYPLINNHLCTPQCETRCSCS